MAEDCPRLDDRCAACQRYRRDHLWDHESEDGFHAFTLDGEGDRHAALAPDLLAFVAHAVPQLDQTGPPLTWAARQQLAAQGRALLAQAEGETA